MAEKTPERLDLESKVKELGGEFPHNIGDIKLSIMYAELVEKATTEKVEAVQKEADEKIKASEKATTEKVEAVPSGKMIKIKKTVPNKLEITEWVGEKLTSVQVIEDEFDMIDSRLLDTPCVKELLKMGWIRKIVSEEKLED